jgi:hypothetical protein
MPAPSAIPPLQIKAHGYAIPDAQHNIAEPTAMPLGWLLYGCTALRCPTVLA